MASINLLGNYSTACLLSILVGILLAIDPLCADAQGPTKTTKKVQSVEVTFMDHGPKSDGQNLIIRVMYDSVQRLFGTLSDTQEWDIGMSPTLTVINKDGVDISSFRNPTVEIAMNSSRNNSVWTTELFATAIMDDGSRIPIIHQGKRGELSRYTNSRYLWNCSKNSPFTEEPIKGITAKDFIVVSSVKTIFGVAPKNEFVDVTARFNWGDSPDLFFSLLEFNIPLGSLDSGVIKAIGQGAASFNVVIFNSEQSTRQGFAGIEFRLFNGDPLAGIHIGGIEKSGPLLTSFLTISFVRRLSPVQNNTKLMRHLDSLALLEAPTSTSSSIHPIPFNNNILFSFALHSNKVDYFKKLRVKGGILIPLFDAGFYGNPGRAYSWRPSDIQPHIALEIPINDIDH